MEGTRGGGQTEYSQARMIDGARFWRRWGWGMRRILRAQRSLMAEQCPSLGAQEVPRIRERSVWVSMLRMREREEGPG